MYIKYTLERHLKELCENNKEYSDLYSSWDISKKIYTKMLSTILYNYPTYSLHDGSHSENIISSIEMLLGEKRIRQLGPTEVWMILQSSYLHDIGMILPDYLVRDKWKSDEFQRYITAVSDSSDDEELRKAADYIIKIREKSSEHLENSLWPLEVRRCVTVLISSYFRRSHASFSQEYMTEKNSICGNIIINDVIQKRLFDLIGKISFLHGEDTKPIMELDYITNGYKSDYVHPRFLAKIIRIGDLLDSDNDRFNDTLCSVYGEMPNSSDVHYRKHKAIEHLLITPETIEIRANCNDPEVYRETRNWFDWLESEVEHFAIEWSNIVPEDFSDSAPKIKKLEVLLKGNKIKREDIDLKFTFEKNDAFELLEGSGIYENKRDCIRELIQNALDATKLQFWRDLKEGTYDAFINTKNEEETIDYSKLTPFDFDSKVYENYRIDITTGEDENGAVRLCVKDRGIGIGTEDLRYISKPGQSWDKRDHYKNDLEKMPAWLRPTGGFGIGIHSCFGVSEEIEINTKSDTEIGKKIILKSPRKTKGYFYIEDFSEIRKRGTSITLKMKRKEDQEIRFALGGHYYDTIRTTDPFERENIVELILWVEDYIYSNRIGFSLFKIYFNNIYELTRDSDYYRKSICRNEKYSKEYFSYDEVEQKLIFWDSFNNVFAKMRMNKLNKYGGGIEYRFKGIDIDTRDSAIQMNIIANSFSFDFNGFSAKEYLTVDRKKLKKIKINYVKDIVYEVIKKMLNTIKQLVLGDDVKICGVEACILYLDLLNNEIFKDFSEKRQFLNKIKGSETLSLKKIKFEEEAYQVKESNFKELIEQYPEISAINDEQLSYNIRNEVRDQKITEEELVNSLNDGKINTEENETIWVLERPIFNLLKRKYGVDSISILENKMSKDDEKIYNYSKKIEVIKLIDSKEIHMIKVNVETKTIILKDLIKEDVGRNAIVGISEYPKIVVNDFPWGIHYHAANEIYYNYSYIISPFTNENIDCKTKEEAISAIKNTRAFENLVEYVQKKTIWDEKASIEEIKGDYFKLIGDYYDLVKNKQ